MAPIKRPVNRVFDDDSTSDASEEELDQSSSSSLSQSGSRKRRRTTNTTSIHEDSDLGDDFFPPTIPSNLDNEEAFEALATQAIREKYNSPKDNLPAECGILEEVDVKNFMCHKHCIFKLGPLINFICGKNGSGKSAILTAITLCLGAKAASTNRGGSLKKFIKEGEEQATIQVKIKNQGDSGYMNSVYGDTIIVQRHFNKTGTSGFKILTINGKIVSTKRATLDEICDHFSLQIDNPMNVLSQDQARQFISTSTASFLYKQFVKGVQLEQLDQDYRLIEESLEKIEVKLEARAPDVKALEKKKQAAENKLALFEKHDGMSDRMKSYRRQLAWVQVERQEALLQEYVKEVADADTKIADFQAHVDRLATVYAETEELSTAAQRKHEEAQDALKEVVEIKNGEKKEMEERKEAAVTLQAEQRNIKGTLKDNEKTINAKRKEIEEEQQRLAERDGGGATARLAALEKAKEAVQEAQKEVEVHKEKKPRLVEEDERLIAELKAREDALQAQQTEVVRQEQRLVDLNSNRSQLDASFHPNMPNLLREISQERRFAQRPVGPLGKHIRLRHPEWSSILEKSFGSNLNGFIVTSKSDMNLLNNLMNKVRVQVPIIIGNNEVIDTTPNEPDEKFLTILRALEIDNHLVLKQLVIQNAIEQTILIADQEDASRAMYDGPRPKNVKRCYCLNSKNKRTGYMLTYTRNNEPSQDFVPEYIGVSRMNTDNEAQIRFQREAVEDAKRQHHQLENNHRAVRDMRERAKQAIVRHGRLQRDLIVAQQTAEDKVEELKGAISEDNIEGGKLDVLRNALQEAEDRTTILEAAYQDSVVALDAARERLGAARATLAACDERTADAEAKAIKASKKHQELDKKKTAADRERNAQLAKLNDGRETRDILDEKRMTKANDIERFIEMATAVCPRINIDEGETQSSLEKKFKHLAEEFEAFEKRVGISKEDAAKAAAETVEAYNAAKKDLKDLEILGAKLKCSLVERRDRWRIFRSFISCRAKAQFTYLLSERSFRGRLITDHQQQLLELSVEPDITKRSGEGRGARTLSGGEKSFSQICLLLAIWEAMGSPIRCLDEFDVYMDAVNRGMSVRLLVEAARQSVGRQFILISPGTKSDIAINFRGQADISTHEMPEAVRGQTRLDGNGAIVV